MPDADDILDAVTQAAVDGIRRSKVGAEEVEALSIEDRIRAAEFTAGGTAAGLTHFGMRRVQQVPPGAG